MERDELKSRIQQQLSTLRDASDQKSAVAWMRDAYLLLEGALRELDQPPQAPAQVFSFHGLQPIISTPTTKVYALRDSVLHRHPHIWLQGQTVQYADAPPPVRKPLPEPVPLALRVGKTPKTNRQYGSGR